MPTHASLPRSLRHTPLRQAQLAADVVLRYYRELGARPGPDDLANALIDVLVCHTHGCPLDWRRLMNAPARSLVGDIQTIRTRLDRFTGRLPDGVPLHYRRQRRRTRVPA